MSNTSIQILKTAYEVKCTDSTEQIDRANKVCEEIGGIVNGLWRDHQDHIQVVDDE